MKTTLVLILLLIIQNLFAQQNDQPYKFPVRPGSEKWRMLNSNAEKVAACQVPSNVLDFLTTKDLLETCLTYPLLPDIMTFNNLQDGFDKFRADFNGAQELFKRKDVADVIFARYKNFDPLEVKSEWTLIEKGQFSVELSIIELFLAQEEVLQQLTLARKQNVLKELLDKYDKKSRKDIYGSLSYLTNAYCLAKIIETEPLVNRFNDESQKKAISYFAKKGNVIDTNTFTEIISLSKQLLP